jgi:putative type I restriction-modification system, S subunit
MSEWKFLTLKEAELEFIDGDRGINYPKKSELLLEGDCVFLNTGNVRQNSFDFSNLDFITKEKDNLLRNGKLQRDDIVLTTRGTVGNVALYSQEVPFSNIRINSGMVIIRVNKNFWHPYFVYLFFQSHLFKKQISRLISGSAQPQLPISILETVSIPQLTLDEQKEIIFNIKSIDQKIQINNQINQELETMAKTLYDYWFVQFDFPDQNGKPYKSSGGKMVYNPELKREIPEGWGVEKLGDVAYLKAGGDKPSNISEIQSKETPFPIYSNGLDNKGLYGYTNKATIHKKSLTVSARGTIGYVQRRFSPFFPIIRLISVTPKEEKMIGYIENFLKSIQFENSGSVQRQLTVPQIDKLYILVPKNEVLKKYHSMSVNYYSEVENNEQQNQELTQLRDWLLPMLMNGQVKVE